MPTRNPTKAAQLGLTWVQRNSLWGMAWVLIFVVLASIATGPATNLIMLWQTLTKSATEAADHQTLTILWQIRLPRIMQALLVGSALAAAGMLSQAVFRNALASPSVLGVESGAVFFAVLATLILPLSWLWFAAPLAAFGGAVLTTAIVLKLAQSRSFQGLEGLLLLGIALGAMYAALTTFILATHIEQHRQAARIFHWLLGNLGDKSSDQVLGALPVVAFALLICWHMAARLDTLMLGFDHAQSLGLDPLRLHRQCVWIISLLVGISISLAGGIAFVSLIVPHICRLIVGPYHRPLLIASCLMGALLVTASDLIARTIAYPQSIPSGIVISLVGAPVFVTMILRHLRGQPFVS